ncbi:MAG: MATE family efflux transporter [Anaerolineae bacterium]
MNRAQIAAWPRAMWERIGRAQSGGMVDDVQQVFTLALPAVGEQMLNMAVGIVDTFLVGHLGAAALAAVGLSNQIVMMANVLFAAIAVGSTALIARSIGARDYALANRVLHQSILLGAAVGLLSTVLGVTLAGQAMRLMGAQDEALRLSIIYLRTVAFTFLLSTLLFVGNACLRGAGDTRTPLRVMMLVNAVNIVVAWTLINGPLGLPRFGVLGSALGAAAGRSLGGALVLWVLWHGRSGLRLRRWPWPPDLPTIRRVLNIGLPSGVEQLLMRLGQVSFARVVASLGTTAYAAHAVALNAESISFMPGFGFAVAATTLVGQGLGANDPDRAQRHGYMAYALGAGVMSLMGIVFIFMARPLVSVFTNDPEVIELATWPLQLIGFVQPLLAAMMIFAGALRGAGDTRAPMIITGAGLWLVRVPLGALLALALGWGLKGAWIAMAVDLTVRGSFNFLRFRSGRWKEIKA